MLRGIEKNYVYNKETGTKLYGLGTSWMLEILQWRLIIGNARGLISSEKLLTDEKSN